MTEHEEINGSTSDGYHTFDELYEHRTYLFAAAFGGLGSASWKSKLHHDGTMYDGMFIAGFTFPSGKQISYHQDLKYWDLFDSFDELDRAPLYDGHTPADSLDRIKEWIEL